MLNITMLPITIENRSQKNVNNVYTTRLSAKMMSNINVDALVEEIN